MPRGCFAAFVLFVAGLMLAGCQNAAVVKEDAGPALAARSAQTSSLLEAGREGLAKLAEKAKAKKAEWIEPWVEAIGLMLERAGKSAAATENLVDLERGQKAQIAEELKATRAERDELKQSWGHRWQVRLTRWFWEIVAAVSVVILLATAHVVLSVVGLMVPGNLGAVAAFAGRIVNPLGWFTWLCDNLHFRGASPSGKAITGGTPVPQNTGGM